LLTAELLPTMDARRVVAMALKPEIWVIVYYRGPGIVVTSHYIENGEGRHRIRDLRAIRRAEAAARSAHLLALALGTVEVGLSAGLAVAYGSAPLVLVGLAAAAATAAALIIGERRGSRWATLEATSGSRRVVLYRSRSNREFQRVRRAVIRAVEANRDPRP
jgi:Zn-dependent M28 family amino/carboxypeptidase